MVEADSSEREVDGNMRIIYVPQTVYFSGANRHAYEPSSASAGPAESGVVSKWRMKDRVSCILYFYVLCGSLLPFSFLRNVGGLLDGDINLYIV